MDPTKFFTRMTLKHNGIWIIPLPFKKVYVVGDPGSVERILRRNASNYGRSKIVREVIGSDLGDEGLFAIEDGDLHQRLQRIMHPFFARGKMGEMAQLVGPTWEPYMRSLKKSTEQPVKVYEVFSQFSVDLLMKYMFDKSATPAEIAELSRLAPPVFKQMFIRVALSILCPPLGVFFMRARKKLDKKVWVLVKKPLDVDTKQDDLLSQLKTATDLETGEKMTDKQIRDQVFTILMAGFDSSATVWAWIIRHLAKHPEVLFELQTEVKDALQGQAPTWEDVMHRLPKLMAKVMELVNEHVAFPMFFRGARGQDTLNGRKVGKGTTIIINLQAMHQLLGQRQEPHAVNLEQRSPYIPFGLGKRQCIGKFLALVMIFIPLVRMLQEFETWTIPSSHIEDTADYAMTNPPKGGAPVEFKPFEDDVATH